MPVHNAEIAAMLVEIADLLDVEGANPFRIRAYRNAARTVSGLGQSVRSMLERGESLETLPGVGADLAGKMAEIARTGRCALLERLRGEVPSGVAELLHIQGLGPKRVRILHQELGVRNVAELHQAALQGRIRELAGFGSKTEQSILERTQERGAQEQRILRSDAAPVAQELLERLRGVPGVVEAVAAGSLRRARETVGDLDLLVSAEAGSPVIERFLAHEDVREVLQHGAVRASVRLRGGLQVDLRVVAPASFGAALLYFTGSKAHNIALRRRAQAAGLKVNEYAVSRRGRPVAGATEESVYAALGLPWIAPELREDRGELEAARQGRLPSLVQRGDLRGDLHAHTRESDGHESLEAMAAAAQAAGLEYLAITDHSRRLAMAHGLDPERLARQIDRIDQLNESLRGLRLLKGIEVDILEDGSLDLPDSILQRLDLVVGAVHHRFELPRARQTERVLRAMDQRYFSILAHPTGRLLGERPAYEIDLLRVIRKAKQRGCFLELNANPQRLDLDDEHCRMAKDEGVLICINSDAHSAAGLGNLAWGIGQARRGWLEAADVLNTRSAEEVQRRLAATLGRGAPARGARARHPEAAKEAG